MEFSVKRSRPWLKAVTFQDGGSRGRKIKKKKQAGELFNLYYRKSVFKVIYSIHIYSILLDMPSSNIKFKMAGGGHIEE